MLFRTEELNDAYMAAREAHAAVERRVIELPALTAAGIGVKARVWSAKRAGEFGTMWDIKLPAPLQAVVDAALSLGRLSGGA